MTKPISHERVTYLVERLKVVEEMLKIAKGGLYTMKAGGTAFDELRQAVGQLNIERSLIEIELRVLQNLGVAE